MFLILPLIGVPKKDFSMQKLPLGLTNLLLTPGTESVVYHFTSRGNELNDEFLF